MSHDFRDTNEYMACLSREDDRARMADWENAEHSAQARKSQEIELAYDQHELAAI